MPATLDHRAVNALCGDDLRQRIAQHFDVDCSAPHSKGVLRGDAETDLEVRVQVTMLDELPVEETELVPEIVMPHYETMGFQEQQQQ